ncbi:MAG: DUF3786 domain-containing protein [Candidatus Bathyarchaeota archaeon]
MRKVNISNLVGLEAFEGGFYHKKFVEESLKERTKVLKHLSIEDMIKIVPIVGGEVVNLKIGESTDWAVMVKPIPSFEIFYILQRGEPEFEDKIHVLFSKDALNLGIPAEDVADFVVLYANALIYAAKKVKSDLPKISRYL